jgi:hypothetical protein
MSEIISRTRVAQKDEFTAEILKGIDNFTGFVCYHVNINHFGSTYKTGPRFYAAFKAAESVALPMLEESHKAFYEKYNAFLEAHKEIKKG